MSKNLNYNLTFAPNSNISNMGNIFTTGGNVGIGTSAPAFTVDINGTLDASNPNGSFLFASSGNVGIGTSAPAFTVDINGTLDASNPNGSFLFASSGNVLIGTTNNANASAFGNGNLMLYGTGATNNGISMNGLGNTTLQFLNSGTMRGALALVATAGNWSTDSRVGDMVIRCATNQSMLFNTNSGTGVSSMIISGGNVGVGTTAPTSTLDVINNSTGQFPVISRFLAPNTTGGSSQSPRIVVGIDATDSISMSYYKAGTTSANNYIGWGHNNVADGQMVLTRAGNVGINTGTPGNLLSIQGTGGTTGTLAFHHSTNTVPHVGIGYNQTADGLAFYYNNGSSSLNSIGMFMTRFGTGNVGIGTTTPGRQLTLSGSSISELMFESRTATTDSKRWTFGTNNTVFYGYTVNDANNATSNWLQVNRSGLTISSTCFPNGNVGVSTTSPLAKLDILGGSTNVGASGSPMIALQYVTGGFRHFIRSRHNGINANDIGNGIDFYLNNSGTGEGSSAPGTGNVLAMSITANGVGIGTASPSGAQLYVIAGASGYSWPTAGYYFTPGNSTLAQANAGGGSISPNNSILTAGSITSATGFYATSDIRIKNVSEVPIDTNLIDLLNPVQFTYKDIIAKGTLTKLGFVAQRVKEYIPGAVSIRKEVIPDIFKKCNITHTNGYIHVHLDNHNLNPGQNIKVIVDQQDRLGKIIIVQDILDPNTFIIDLNLPTTQTELFIYGREVDDLLDVDYNILSTLAFAGVKEVRRDLYKILQTTGNISINTSSGTHGIGISSNGIYASGSQESQDINLTPKGNGTVNIQSNISCPNFKAIQLFEHNNISWNNGVDSQVFTVGNGAKWFNISYSCYSSSSNTQHTAFFDIYTSTGNLVSTLNHNFYFNFSGQHLPNTYTNLITDEAMPAGTYYVKARTSASTDTNDTLFGTLINYPF